MTMVPSHRATWLVPAGLLVLAAVPIVAGGLRVAELTGGAGVTQENARFFAAPVPVLTHIFGSVGYCVLGAFQFAPRFRRDRPGWHRVAGRLLVPCGLAVALSGVWMALFHPHPELVGDALTTVRVVFGTAMAAAIVLGVVAIRRRDVAGHRAWMIRAYAIGLGAGTQVFTSMGWLVLVGRPDEFGYTAVMLAGWVINVVVAELVIGRAIIRLTK